MLSSGATHWPAAATAALRSAMGEPVPAEHPRSRAVSRPGARRGGPAGRGRGDSRGRGLPGELVGARAAVAGAVDRDRDPVPPAHGRAPAADGAGLPGETLTGAHAGHLRDADDRDRRRAPVAWISTGGPRGHVGRYPRRRGATRAGGGWSGAAGAGDDDTPTDGRWPRWIEAAGRLAGRALGGHRTAAGGPRRWS